MKTDIFQSCGHCWIIEKAREFQKNIYFCFIDYAIAFDCVQFNSVQSLSRVQLFTTPWTTACQVPLFITNSRSLLKLFSMESVMPSNHLILCPPLLLLPSIFPSIRVFSNESALRIRWPKYWSFTFNISPSNELSGLISFRMDWLDLLAVQGTLKNLLQHYSSKASILLHLAFFFFFFSSTTLLLPAHLPPPPCTRAQSCNPMDFSLPGSSVHGLFQARILEWVAISFSTLSFLYSPTLTSIHDYWKIHGLDEMDLCWQSNVSAF